MFRTTLTVVRKVAGDVRMAALAFVVAVGAIIALPAPAWAAGCAPGSVPTTGCQCSKVSGFVACGCCEWQDDGDVACLYCRQE